MTHPVTLEEIAQDVFSHLSPGDVKAIKAVPDKSGMIQFHFIAGMSIRNKYNLWKPDHPLTQNGKHPDDVSMEILERVWELTQ